MLETGEQVKKLGKKIWKESVGLVIHNSVHLILNLYVNKLVDIPYLSCSLYPELPNDCHSKLFYSSTGLPY